MNNQFKYYLILVSLTAFSIMDVVGQGLKECALELGVWHQQDVFALGNGVSFVDFDQDGWDDLTIGSPAGQFIHFYKNNEGSFEQIIPPLVSDQQDSKQVLWNDYDNDGDLDLFVAVFGGYNKLYRNDGDLKLVDVTVSAGIPLHIRRSYGATWGDYNRDGWLDLYFSYRQVSFLDGPNECRLLQNNGDGTFTDVSIESNTLDQGRLPFMSVMMDFNNDQWPDIYTANDRNIGNTVLLNNKNNSFLRLDDDTNGAFRISGMGIADTDLDRDGDIDIYVSNEAEGNIYLRNKSTTGGEIRFDEIAEETMTSFNEISWGVNFLDIENDGDDDLYISGSIDGSDAKSSALFENMDGNYINNTAGRAADTTISYANALGDINNDGLADIMVQNSYPYPSQLWMNKNTSGNWVKLSLQGELSNRDGIGSRMSLYANGVRYSKESTAASSFLGQNSRQYIFGLGESTIIDSVVIDWPTGHTDRIYNIGVNQKIQVTEGSSTNGNIDIDPAVSLLSDSDEVVLSDNSDFIYPNPSNDRLVFTDDVANNMTGVTIFDHNGITVYRSDIKVKSISLLHLPKGIFIIKVNSNENKKHLYRWIKL